MSEIVYKLVAMLLPLFLGYVLKRVGLFGAKDYRILSKITMNVTLPAAVIYSFSTFDMDASFLFIAVLSFVANWVVQAFCLLTTRSIKDKPIDRVMTCLCAGGYNMGNFIIPFVQQFLGGPGVALASIYDSGNTMMCTGGIYVFATTVTKVDGKAISLKGTVMKLLKSVPMLVYTFMIIWALFGGKVSGPVATIVGTTGSANAFISMFMTGLMFEIQFDKAYLKQAAGILGRKYFCGLVLALIAWYLIPMDLLAKQVVVMCAFSPIPSLAAVYTEETGGNAGLAGFVTASSFLISCFMMVILVFLLGIGA